MPSLLACKIFLLKKTTLGSENHLFIGMQIQRVLTQVPNSRTRRPTSFFQSPRQEFLTDCVTQAGRLTKPDLSASRHPPGADRQDLKEIRTENLKGRCSPKPPNVEPDFGRFEDIRRLWVTIGIKIGNLRFDSFYMYEYCFLGVIAL